jgi:hypothetical protein
MPIGGPVDYTQLNRIGSVLSQQAAQERQNATMGYQLLKDQADAQNASMVRSWVTSQLQPEMIVEPQPSKTTAGKKASATPLSSSGPAGLSMSKVTPGSFATPLSGLTVPQDEPMVTTPGGSTVRLRYKTPMEIVQTMSKAGELLSATGGRHAEQAAKDIHGFMTSALSAMPKDKQPTKASIAMQAAGGDAKKALELMSTSPKGKNATGELYDDPRDGNRYKIIRDPSSGTETKRQLIGPSPISATAGGIGKSTEGLTERSVNGKLRIKTTDKGTPVPITQEKLASIRGQVEDDLSRAMSHSANALQAYNSFVSHRKTAESTMDQNDPMSKAMIEGIRANEDAAWKSYQDWEAKRKNDLEPLLEDINTYDSKKVRAKTPAAKGQGARSYYQSGK